MYTNQDRYQSPENKALLENIKQAVRGIQVWTAAVVMESCLKKGCLLFFAAVIYQKVLYIYFCLKQCYAYKTS